MDPYKSLNFTDAQLTEIASEEQYILRCKGALMRVADENTANQPPTTLFPSPFPKKSYEEAVAVQQDFQRLYFKASCDHEFIKESLKRYNMPHLFLKLKKSKKEEVQIDTQTNDHNYNKVT